jgi:putative peptidoglycan lipid II flippase
MWKTTLLLLPLQIVARAGDALLLLILAAWFGGTRETDLYFFALAGFRVAGSLVFAAFQDSALVPILAGLRASGSASGEDKRRALMRSLLGHTLAYGGALSALIFAVFAAVCAVRYQAADLRLALLVSAPLALLLLATALRTLFTVFLNAAGRFTQAPLSGGLAVLATLAVLAIGRGVGVVIVPLSLLSGELVAASVLAIALRIPLRADLTRPPEMLRFMRLGASELLGGALARLSPLTDQVVASMVSVVGGGTLLTYAGDVAMVPTSLLAASFLPVMLTHVSARVAQRNMGAARAAIVRALLVSMAVLAVSALALAACAGPLLALVYGRGAMDARALSVMADVLPYQALALVPFGAVLVLSRAHVALENTAVLPRVGLLASSCNLLLDVVLGRAIGLEGIALATALTHAISAAALYLALGRAVRLRALRTA